MKIKAAVVHQEGTPFVIEDVDLAPPRAGELLVKIVACGVCHTDDKARSGYFTPFPAVLGHEGAGIIEAVGDNVDEFKVGDHVVLSYPYCCECDNCKKGKPYYCYRSTELSFLGKFKDGYTPLSQNGSPINSFFGQSAFATHAVVPVANAVRVNPDVPLSLLAPLGCGIQTGAGAITNALKPDREETVVIFGTGTVGLSAIMAAAAIPCKTIIAVDVIDARLEIAREYGATDVINSKVSQDVAEEVKRLTGGKGADYALDTTGVEVCTQAALKSMHTGGKGACVAASKKLTLDPAPSYLIGRSWAYLIEGEAVPQEFIPQMIEWYRQGRFPFDRMISFYPFERINEAFEDTKAGLATKAVLLMPD